MTVEQLAARIQVLEDIEAIKKLKATYCYLCDAGLGDPQVRDELLSHFAATARVDFGLGPASIYEGTEALTLFFGTVVPAAVSFCIHMVHNPMIDVHADRATGRWYYEAPTTDTATGRAQWMMGIYLFNLGRCAPVLPFATAVLSPRRDPLLPPQWSLSG